MATGVRVGVGGAVKTVKGIYVGVGGQVKKVTKGYVGVGGVPKLFYSSEASVSKNKSNFVIPQIYPGYANRTNYETSFVANAGNYGIFCYTQRGRTTGVSGTTTPYAINSSLTVNKNVPDTPDGHVYGGGDGTVVLSNRYVLIPCGQSQAYVWTSSIDYIDCQTLQTGSCSGSYTRSCHAVGCASIIVNGVESALIGGGTIIFLNQRIIHI